MSDCTSRTFGCIHLSFCMCTIISCRQLPTVDTRVLPFAGILIPLLDGVFASLQPLTGCINLYSPWESSSGQGWGLELVQSMCKAQMSCWKDEGHGHDTTPFNILKF